MDSDILLIILGVLFVGALGGLIVMFSAQKIASLNNATFINSSLVVIIGYAFSILLFVGFQALTHIDNIVSLAIFLIIIETIAGKIIWKCKWSQSLKAIFPCVLLIVMLFAMGMK